MTVDLLGGWVLTLLDESQNRLFTADRKSASAALAAAILCRRRYDRAGGFGGRPSLFFGFITWPSAAPTLMRVSSICASESVSRCFSSKSP